MYIYSCLSNNKKLRTVPYNSLRHADNRRYFLGLCLTRNRREAHMFYLAREAGNFGHVLAEKKVNFMMINEFKYGQT